MGDNKRRGGQRGGKGGDEKAKQSKATAESDGKADEMEW